MGEQTEPDASLARLPPTCRHVSLTCWVALESTQSWPQVQLGPHRTYRLLEPSGFCDESHCQWWPGKLHTGHCTRWQLWPLPGQWWCIGGLGKPYPTQEQRVLLSLRVTFIPPFMLWSKWQSPVPAGAEIPRGGCLHCAVVQGQTTLGSNPGTLTLGKEPLRDSVSLLFKWANMSYFSGIL